MIASLNIKAFGALVASEPIFNKGLVRQEGIV